MFNLFKKKNNEEEINEEESNNILKKEVTTIGILEGEDNPWDIIPFSKGYGIKVFTIDNNEWCDLEYCSSKVIGVDKEEFLRFCEERFNSITENGNQFFNNKEDAEKLIKDISPYYDTYHIPHAIANRLSFYNVDEGGYPPYFMKYPKVRKSQENEKKKLKLAE